MQARRRAGFAIATLARSQLAGIGVGIAVYFGEQFASIFLPDVVKYLPFNAANAVVATSGSFGGGGGGAVVSRLDPNTALLVVAAWLIGGLLVTVLYDQPARGGAALARGQEGGLHRDHRR